MATNREVTIKLAADDLASPKIKNVVSNLGNLGRTASMVDRGFSKVGRGIDRAMGFGLRSIRSVVGMVESLGHKLIWAGGVAAATLGGISYKALSLSSQFEQAGMAFETMLGGKGKADALLETLEKFAAVTPFQFGDLVGSTQRLMAYGFKAGEIIPVLTAIGDAAAAFGANAETIDRVTLAIGQIKAKGMFSGEEMRQLAEAGIPAWQILAEVIGKDIPTAMKMAENRTIRADQYLNKFVERMGSRFPGQMAKASQSLGGLGSTLRDVIEIGLRKVGDVMSPTFKGLARGFTYLFEELFSDKNMGKFKVWWDKTFSRENVYKAATFFGNLIVWSKDAGGVMIEYIGKAGKFIGDTFKWLRHIIGDEFMGVLKLVTKSFLYFKSIAAGLAVTTGMAQAGGAIASMAATLPDKKAGAALAAVGAGLVIAAPGAGAAVAAGGIVGTEVADYYIGQIAKVLGEKMAKEMPAFPPFPKFGGMASSSAEPYIKGFMDRYDALTINFNHQIEGGTERERKIATDSAMMAVEAVARSINYQRTMRGRRLIGSQT